jgi:hypothetical protein
VGVRGLEGGIYLVLIEVRGADRSQDIKLGIEVRHEHVDVIRLRREHLVGDWGLVAVDLQDRETITLPEEDGFVVIEADLLAEFLEEDFHRLVIINITILLVFETAFVELDNERHRALKYGTLSFI